MWNCCGNNDQIANRDLKLKFISIRKVKTEEEKLKRTERDNVVYWKTNGKINNDLQCTQVQRSDFRDSAKVKRLRQIKAEMV